MRILIVAVLVLAACTPPAFARKWTDSTGKHTIEAEFVEYKSGKAWLKKENGQIIGVTLERLSRADRDFVATAALAKANAEIEDDYSESASPSKKPPAEPIPTYKIIGENTEDPFYKQRIKRSVDVRLAGKVSEGVLRTIAMKIKNADPNSYQRTFICYYLPGETVNKGCWATTHFDPDLEVRILGLSIEQEKTLKERPQNSSRKLIATWNESYFELTRRITIFREDGKLFVEMKFRDGGIVKEEAVERRSAACRRFDTKKESDDFDGYFLIDAQGNVQHWHTDGQHETATDGQNETGKAELGGK